MDDQDGVGSVDYPNEDRVMTTLEAILNRYDLVILLNMIATICADYASNSQSVGEHGHPGQLKEWQRAANEIADVAQSMTRAKYGRIDRHAMYVPPKRGWEP